MKASKGEMKKKMETKLVNQHNLIQINLKFINLTITSENQRGSDR